MGVATIIGLGVAACLLGMAFVRRERHAPEPVLPGRMLRTRAARLAAAINFTSGIVFWPALYFTAAFLQYVRGVDPGLAGVYLAPFMAGAVGGNLVSGRRVAHTGRYRRWPILGGVAALAGAAMLGVADDPVTPLAFVLAGAAVAGFGVGLTMQVVLLVAQNEVELRDLGVATSTTFLARQMGGAMALAALGSVLNNRLAHWIPRLTPPRAGLDLGALRGSPEAVRDLAPSVADGVVDAFARSLASVFWRLVPVAVVWVVLAVLFPERPLRSEKVVGLDAVDDTGLAAIALAEGGGP